jgi:hypothetical protein
MRLAVFMTRVYDLQLFFGLCMVTRSEARSAGSLVWEGVGMPALHWPST